MRRIALLMLGGSFMTAVLHGQVEERVQRRDSLRGEIQQRFARQVQQQLGLDRTQVEQVRQTIATWWVKRRELELRERSLRAALAAQMRPGIAADQDSVARLTDQLLAAQIAQVESYRDELREMSYLNAVQRARYLMLRDRLAHRIEEVRVRSGTRPARQRRAP